MTISQQHHPNAPDVSSVEDADMRAVSTGLLSLLLKFHGDRPPDKESAIAVAEIRRRFFPVIHKALEPVKEPEPPKIEAAIVETESAAARTRMSLAFLEQAVAAGKVRQRRERLINRHQVAFTLTRGGYLPDKLTMAHILKDVADKYGLSILQMRSRTRGRGVVFARQEAMYRCYQETTQSLPSIARFFGGFDHTTVMHAIRSHEARTRRG